MAGRACNQQRALANVDGTVARPSIIPPAAILGLPCPLRSSLADARGVVEHLLTKAHQARPGCTPSKAPSPGLGVADRVLQDRETLTCQLLKVHAQADCLCGHVAVITDLCSLALSLFLKANP